MEEGGSITAQVTVAQGKAITDVETALDVELDRIRNEPGNVYIPFHPELALFAEKPAFANWISLLELSGGFGGETKDEWSVVSRELVNAIKKNRFNLIILDMDQFFGHPELYYSSSEMDFMDKNSLYPVTGVPFQPVIMYYKAGE
jgi:hypothetical protein